MPPLTPAPAPQPNAPEANPVQPTIVPGTPTSPEVSSLPNAQTGAVILPAGSALDTQPGAILSASVGGATTNAVQLTPEGDSKEKYLMLERQRRRLMLLAVIFGAALCLLVAAAYFGLYLPSRPGAAVASSIGKTLNQKKVGINSTYQITNKASKDPDLSKLTITLSGQLDEEKSAYDLNFGIVNAAKNQFSGELRQVGGTVYFKLVGLTALSSTTQTYGLYEVNRSISKEISNQWFAFDKNDLSQLGNSCLLTIGQTFSSSDSKKISSNYKSANFAKVTSTQGVRAYNGQTQTRYKLSVDDNKLSTFLKKSDAVSFSSKLGQCINAVANSSVVSQPFSKLAAADSGHTPLTIYTDNKTKLVTQLVLDTPTVVAARGDSAALNLQLSYTQLPDITPPADFTKWTEATSTELSQLQSLRNSNQTFSTNIQQILKDSRP